MSGVRPIRDPRLGTVLRGTYRLEEVLGRGGTGAVYRAVNVSDGSAAAVKVLRAGQGLLGTADTAVPLDQVSDDQRIERRFAREARIVGALDHPHIVKIFDFDGDGEGEGEAYLAMELLDGEPLAQLLKRRALSPEEALKLYGPLCDAMHYAHERDVVHRDLKPDNVFLVECRLDDPRVLDFGISKLLQPDASQLTTDAILGTPAYMAPELVRAPASVDRRADLFALGAMLFHALTGHLPFEGDTVLAVLHKVLQARPPSVRHFKPALSPALDEVLARCMAREPAGRYQTALELLAALDAAVHAAPAPRELPVQTALLPQVPLLQAISTPHEEAVAQTLMMPQVEAEPPPPPPGSAQARTISQPPQPASVSGAGLVVSRPQAVLAEPSLSLDLRRPARPLLPARFWLAALLGGAAGALLALLLR